jgi:hypothetical protein
MNDLHLIRNKDSFLKLFWGIYPNDNPKKLPKYYPCLIYTKEDGGGLIGEVTTFYAIYPKELKINTAELDNQFDLAIIIDKVFNLKHHKIC